MSKPCRLIHAHVHKTLPRESMYTARLAAEQAPDGLKVLRIRWLDSREWQVCYG